MPKRRIVGLQRELAQQLLVLDQPVPDYLRFLPAFIESGKPFLDETSFEAISRASIEPRRLLAPQTTGVYSWWGYRYAWSPDGRRIAYASPDQVGWIDVGTGRVFPLAPYPPQAPHGTAQGDQV